MIRYVNVLLLFPVQTVFPFTGFTNGLRCVLLQVEESLETPFFCSHPQVFNMKGLLLLSIRRLFVLVDIDCLFAQLLIVRWNLFVTNHSGRVYFCVNLQRYYNYASLFSFVKTKIF